MSEHEDQLKLSCTSCGAPIGVECAGSSAAEAAGERVTAVSEERMTLVTLNCRVLVFQFKNSPEAR